METFVIAPAATRISWALMAVPVILVLVIVGGALALAMNGARATRFEVSPQGLRVRGDLYGRVIPAAELRVDAAHRVDWPAEHGLEPRWRTMGTGLPGYRAGWFRLANGDKALLYLTDRSRAVYVPTTAGYGVLLSPSDPDAFLSALRKTRDR